MTGAGSAYWARTDSEVATAAAMGGTNGGEAIFRGLWAE